MNEVASVRDRVPERPQSTNLSAEWHVPKEGPGPKPKLVTVPPYLEFTNDIYPSEKSSEKPTSDKAVTDKPANEWTVAVQLAASNPSKGPDDTAKLDQIKQLAQETKDKPVTMLVQRVVPTEDGSTPNIERYELAGGELTRLPDVKSKGFDEDIQDLVSSASNDHPAKKLALVVQSHGEAGVGMYGDNGRTTIDKLSGAIKNGLNGSGHDKMDLIDLDACVMSESTVMDKIKSVAKDVVASEEVESSVRNSDGQNLKESLKHVTNDPSISGNELAEKMIANAKAGLNDEGIHTLSHLNLENYDSFRKDLDALGEQLRSNAANDDSVKTIEQLISKTHKMAAGYDKSQGYEWRDLKAFAQNVQDAIKSQQLKDADGKLMEATSRLLSNFSGDQKIVQSSFGKDNVTMKNMDKLGGLSVYLPENAYLNDDKQNLVKSTSLGMINEKQMDDISKDRKSYETILDHIVKDVKPEASKAPAEFKQLKEAVDAVKAACNLEFVQRKQNLEELNKRLAYSKLNEANTREVQEMRASKRKEILKQEVDAMQDGGWKRFLSHLTAGTY